MIRLIMAIINNKILYVPFILPSIKAIKTRDEQIIAEGKRKSAAFTLLDNFVVLYPDSGNKFNIISNNMFDIIHKTV